jgi:hypothetical protein
VVEREDGRRAEEWSPLQDEDVAQVVRVRVRVMARVRVRVRARVGGVVPSAGRGRDSGG